MVTMQDSTSQTLAEIMIRRGHVSKDDLDTARKAVAGTGARMEQYLVDEGLVTSTHVVLALSEYLDMTPVSLAHFTVSPELTDLAPEKIWEQLQVVPVARVGNMLTVAMGDPFNTMATETLSTITGMEIVPMVAGEKDVAVILAASGPEAGRMLEEVLRDVNDNEVEIAHEEAEEISLDEIMEIAEEAPVIRIVSSIMIEALRKQASDIHIEPMEKSLRLRYRVDGILAESSSPPKRLHPAITSRIKILSNLNIAERRVPQDGRFKIKAMGKECDVRVSILPTVHGEKIVMRILDKTSLAPSLEALGLDQRAYEDFSYAISQPYGMILVTGPTGSGKTTTLYSCLQDLNRIDVNISTVEDPVEYQLPGINQVQTHPQAGLTFAAALRSLLRQDPDIVLVGEIRDGETAEIAVKAALTGHLVLSTLHTNDAAGAVARLNNMGVESFLLGSSLIMTQAQRLYRKVCKLCRQEMVIPSDLLRLNHIDPEKFEGVTFYKAVGCAKCGGLGYKGRGAIMEILLVSDTVRTQIVRDPNADLIRRIAVEGGMATLRDIGFNKVREGLSTVTEILRVTSGG